MHVQSISHWAPANIGPYSQATLVSTFYIIKKDILQKFILFKNVVNNRIKAPIKTMHVQSISHWTLQVVKQH